MIVPLSGTQTTREAPCRVFASPVCRSSPPSSSRRPRPFGHATEEVDIGVCGDTCNIRVVDLPQGSITLRETVTSFGCPGACGGRTATFGGPFSLGLAETIVHGTGLFAGATGTLAGGLTAGGWGGVVTLAGTITLAA